MLQRVFILDLRLEVEGRAFGRWSHCLALLVDNSRLHLHSAQA